MDCPVCKDAMIVLEHDQVEIDHCVSCKGTWLDSGELELLLGHSQRKDQLLSSFEIEKNSKEKARTCPICLKKMEKVLWGAAKEVRIDRCRGGDGLWFDLGELDRIIRRDGGGEHSEVLVWLREVFGKTR